jgi:hypothetical protein
MKAIFLLLLLINIVLAGWSTLTSLRDNTADDRPVVTEKAKPDLPTLKVLTDEQLSNLKVLTSNEGLLQQPDELCSMVGPYKNLAQADILIERLSALDVSAVLETLEIPVEPAYWVYLPPLPSKDSAYRKLSELQALKIDSYVIPKGNLTNGISLGLFNEHSGAIARQEELSAKGYDVFVHTETRTVAQNWVVAKSSESAKITPKIWSSLISNQENVGYQQNFCPTVASLK